MTNCVSGQRVVSEPTPTSNRQCAACPAGTFSQGTNAQDCVPWRECSGAFKEDAPGSATTDRTCKPEWIAQFGSTTSDQALSDSVHVDASGDVILGCRVGSTDVDVAKVFKRSGIDGSEIWTSEPPIGAGDTVFGVGLDQDGGALVVGTTFGNLDGGGQAGNGDAFVMKLSASDGSVVWTTQFGTANHEGAYSVTVDAGGNLIVQGQGHNGVSGPSNFNWNVFVTKLSGTDRTEIWTRTFDSGAPDNALAVGVAPDGSVLLAGNTQGTLAGMGNAGGRDAFVSRLSDTDGAPIWTRQLGSASDDSFLSARADANGNVVVVGRQDSNGVVMKLSGTDGSGLWTHLLPPTAFASTASWPTQTVTFWLLGGRRTGTLSWRSWRAPTDRSSGSISSGPPKTTTPEAWPSGTTGPPLCREEPPGTWCQAAPLALTTASCSSLLIERAKVPEGPSDAQGPL